MMGLTNALINYERASQTLWCVGVLKRVTIGPAPIRWCQAVQSQVELSLITLRSEVEPNSFTKSNFIAVAYHRRCKA